MKKFFTGFFTFFLAYTITAQDIHFSQFNNAILNINPAFTGNFNGQLRASFTYRNQWFAIPNFGTKGVYQTYFASADGAVFKDRSGFDRLSLGAHFYSDRAGNGALTTQQGALSVAYLKTLDKYGSSSISGGIQAGFISKRLFIHDLVFESQFDGSSFNPLLFNGEKDFNSSQFFVPDINAGVAFQHQPNDNLGYYFGAAMYHITQPKETFFGKENKLPRRYTLLAGADINLTDQTKLSPSVLFMSQAAARQLNIGVNFSHEFNDDVKGLLAARFRTKDAMIFSAGVDYQGIKMMLTYDMTSSSLRNANRGNGAVETSIVYILNSGRDSRRRTFDQYCPSL